MSVSFDGDQRVCISVQKNASFLHTFEGAEPVPCFANNQSVCMCMIVCMRICFYVSVEGAGHQHSKLGPFCELHSFQEAIPFYC